MEETNIASGCTRVPTFGEKAVGLTFNPAGDEKVYRVKKLYADIIDIMNEIRNVPNESGDDSNSFNERARLSSIAITEAQSAQMWAVKAITWK
jgi:hypothetical protein